MYNANPGGEEVEPAGDDGGGGGDPLQIGKFKLNTLIVFSSFFTGFWYRF